jgi:hypothetical protein
VIAVAEGYAATSALPTSLDARPIGWLKFKNPNAPGETGSRGLGQTALALTPSYGFANGATLKRM